MVYTDVLIEKQRKASREYMRRKRQEEGYIRWRNISKENYEKHIEYNKNYNYKLMLEILSYYSGGLSKCSCCNETNIDFLTIDHIDGNGVKHRKKNKITAGNPTYRWLRNNNFPEGFQVLCFNCNWSKRINGKCTHNIDKKVIVKSLDDIEEFLKDYIKTKTVLSNMQIYKKRYQIKNKAKVFLYYSNNDIKCNCCGEQGFDFLTIDHIYNNGAEHRRTTKKAKDNMYIWLRRNDYPSGFQVLCMNCNWSKKINKGECTHILNGNDT